MMNNDKNDNKNKINNKITIQIKKPHLLIYSIYVHILQNAQLQLLIIINRKKFICSKNTLLIKEQELYKLKLCPIMHIMGMMQLQYFHMRIFPAQIRLLYAPTLIIT